MNELFLIGMDIRGIGFALWKAKRATRIV